MTFLLSLPVTNHASLKAPFGFAVRTLLTLYDMCFWGTKSIPRESKHGTPKSESSNYEGAFLLRHTVVLFLVQEKYYSVGFHIYLALLTNVKSQVHSGEFELSLASNSVVLSYLRSEEN